MSHRLISRSPDLQRLQTEGYHLEVRLDDVLLLVKDVPYVTANCEVRTDGVLITTLKLAGDATDTPDVHTVEFIGERPCNKEGTPLNLVSNDQRHPIGGGIEVDFQFSRKPVPHTDPPYQDYHQKMTAYVAILQGPAQALQPGVTAQTEPVIPLEEGDSVFCYLDNATTRAGIGAATDKLRDGEIAIIGLGGTGSYVLDLVTKTPIERIHLYDGDVFSQHNAFRSPGAAALDDLDAKMYKVDYLHAIYSRMRRQIVPHATYVDETNVGEFAGMSFVFVCIDDGPSRQIIVEALEAQGVPFVDVGLGVQETSRHALVATTRTSTSTAETREGARRHLPFGSGGGNEDYNRNIQVAELNALNAVLAVIRWKQERGFYCDLEREDHLFFHVDDKSTVRERGCHAD